MPTAYFKCSIYAQTSKLYISEHSENVLNLDTFFISPLLNFEFVYIFYITNNTNVIFSDISREHFFLRVKRMYEVRENTNLFLQLKRFVIFYFRSNEIKRY